MMRIGVMLSMPGQDDTLGGLVGLAQRAERAGLAAAWLPQVFAFDALTVLALAGRETQRIGLGTAVVPTYPRHPAVLAQQALTAQVAAGGRLTLGIGLSHQVVIENMYGLDYSKPIPHTREYLTVLSGLLAGEQVSFQGEHYQVNARLSVPGAARPSVVVAALGPDMLRLCGRQADGTITWMGGLQYLRDIAVPMITGAARAAGRPDPRIVAMVPVCVTSDAAAARAQAGRTFANYGRLPSYRATLDRGGAAGPGDVAVAGTADEVREQIRAFADAGVTDFAAAIFAAEGGSIDGTYETLAAMAASGIRHPV